MNRSFRTQLALRFAVSMAGALAVVAVLSFLAIRATLDRQIDASIANVASIQAAAITEPESGEMRLREWEVTPEEAASVRDVNRFTQVWSAEGRSLLRTRYLTRDLPLDQDALGEALAGELAWSEQRFQEMPVRSLYYPLGRLGEAHEPHVLQVAAPLTARNDTLRSLAALLVGIVVFVSAATFAGSWWLADRAVRPVHEIIDQAEEIEAGTLGRRLRAAAFSREYRRLVEVLNTMLARLDSAFEAQRRFTADASHELRSPLTALRGELELARRRERSPEEYRRVIDSALEEVDRLTRTAEDLLTLARSDAGVLELRLGRDDLGERVRRVVDRLRASADAAGVSLEMEVEGETAAVVDTDRIERLVRNLVENAVRYTPAGGEVAVRVARSDGPVELVVADTGPGIPPEDLEGIFHRFHRVDESRTPARDGSGTGLGLAIARTIAELHGGEVTAANRPGGGAEFRATIPVEPPPEGAS